MAKKSKYTCFHCGNPGGKSWIEFPEDKKFRFCTTVCKHAWLTDRKVGSYQPDGVTIFSAESYVLSESSISNPGQEPEIYVIVTIRDNYNPDGFKEVRLLLDTETRKLTAKGGVEVKLAFQDLILDKVLSGIKT